MARNHTELKSNTNFCPSLSLKAIQLAGDALPTYVYTRADYHSFVYQDKNRQTQGQTYDNTLTCYSKTNETLANELGMSESTLKRQLKKLTDVGLVVSLPFTADGKERRNLVVLDCELTEYLEILRDCADRLIDLIASNRRAAKSKKQLQIIEDILHGYTDEPTEEEIKSTPITMSDDALEITPDEDVQEIEPEPVKQKIELGDYEKSLLDKYRDRIFDELDPNMTDKQVIAKCKYWDKRSQDDDDGGW